MAEFTSKWATWSPTLTTRSDKMELGDTIKLERVTLLIATQTMRTPPGCCQNWQKERATYGRRPRN